MTKVKQELSDDLNRLSEARHHDPFNVLGRHPEGDQVVVRVYLPHTESIVFEESGEALSRVGQSDFFEWKGNGKSVEGYYQLTRKSGDGHVHSFYDPYCFLPQIPDFDLNLFGSGNHLHCYRVLGSNIKEVDGIKGVLFATWAPNAERVSVIGDFNQWDGRVHPMRSRGDSGVWELFIPGLSKGEHYKFEIRNRSTGQILEKTDPYAREFELRPKTASITNDTEYKWQDDSWMTSRQGHDWLHEPMTIYELHLGSWQRDHEGNFLNYREMAQRLVDYIKPMGFTHVELLPVTEHPLDASWGYQTTGYFSPTSRFGSPDDFRFFVDLLHENNIGVFLDWVPAHFPKDEFALARYDGSALYEHEDPRRGEHPDWGTLIYNFGRNEVRNFLIASAVYWLEEFHIDGLRVDAVASMLYLDYSREQDNWIPNIHGGNENLDAISFLRELNAVTHREFPGTVIMAEESTAWPQVTRPIELGGLGFSMKWNMGWMHDTLKYFSADSIYRSYHHDQLTFGLLYLFTENFILPFSHDEVVHGKSSMLYKMPGDEWQQFANLRLIYSLMYTYPGKKLLFMGSEFGQGREWNFNQALDWYVMDYPAHQGAHKLVTDLNHLYRENSALYKHDFEPNGFEWIDCNDYQQSVISFMRKSEDRTLIVILNFTPIPREGYRIGVPFEGTYREVLNSDSSYYGGSNMGNIGQLHTENTQWMDRPHSVTVTLPPLAAIVLEWEQ